MAYRHELSLYDEEFKISDLYYGNYRIDIVTLYKEKSVKIPKVHLDYDIMPNFYFVVQIGSKIKEAKMIGFINSKVIPSSPCDNKYIYPELDNLFRIDKFHMFDKIVTKLYKTDLENFLIFFY